MFFILAFQCITVNASDTVKARIGNQFFDTLEEAINAASSTDIITLTNNVTLNKTLEINKNVNINLNNKTISANEQVFLVRGGSLNLSGNGTIKETKPNYGAIVLKGSDDPSKKDFSTISVGNGITLEGWSGIFINQVNKTGYGILVNMNGNINAVDDINGSPGAGIYVNGSIENQNNSPIINLSDTVNITSTGTGIYAAGYANYYINGAHIQGEQSGLGIKSGTFKILDGNILGTGEDKTPTGGNNNGINASGAAIQIESNTGYVGNIQIDIRNGVFKSNKSYVIYEYTVNDSSTQVKNIDISGGTFISNIGKSVISTSDNFKNKHSNFISGGTYSSNPIKFLKEGYGTQISEDSLYKVVSNTTSTFALQKEGSTNLFIPMIIIISSIIVVVISYFNKQKIFDFINLIRKK